jgi:hypothetical protein
MENKLDSYIEELDNCEKEKLESIADSIKEYQDIPVVKDKYKVAIAKAKTIGKKYGITITT